MLKNILKIVFLGVVGFGLLIYLTAEKPQNLTSNKKEILQLDLKEFPTYLELVGEDKMVLTTELFKKEKNL